MGVVLFILTFIANSVKSDISHLNHLFFGKVNNLYNAPSIPGSIPTQSFLPEVIINRKIKNQGYNYESPDDHYLPPSNIPNNPPENHFSPESPSQSPIVPFPPIVVGDPQIPQPSPVHPGIPDQAYLPPNPDHQPEIVVSYPEPDSSNEDGYHYEAPTLSTTSSTTQRPVGFPSGFDIPQIPNLNPGYIYSTTKPPDSSYLPPEPERSPKDLFSDQSKNPIHLQVIEMRCLVSQAGYFKSSLKINSFIVAVPTIDNDVIDTRCDLRLRRSYLIVNIASEDFQRCGVAHCGNNNLCLKIRFPAIKGMKTSSDSVLTLQCKTQDRIVAKTHSLKMGVTKNELQGRSIGTFAQGGNQQPFRTHVELLRKVSNGWRIIERSGIVQLGEELQLRAQVHAGDGWNFTRLSDVQLQRISPSGEILNSAVLVTSSGCINPSMRAICPHPPVLETPLDHRLIFKAVMFQGMRSGDEMLMTIKIAGCMDQIDCFINTGACENNHHDQLNRFARSRRSTTTRNSTEYSDISTISFRVEMPQTSKLNYDDKINTAHFFVGGVLAFICLLSSIAIIVYFKQRK